MSLSHQFRSATNTLVAVSAMVVVMSATIAAEVEAE
jgi:hypothetical protein